MNSPHPANSYPHLSAQAAAPFKTAFATRYTDLPLYNNAGDVDEGNEGLVGILKEYKNTNGILKNLIKQSKDAIHTLQEENHLLRFMVGDENALHHEHETNVAGLHNLKRSMQDFREVYNEPRVLGTDLPDVSRWGGPREEFGRRERDTDDAYATQRSYGDIDSIHCQRQDQGYKQDVWYKLQLEMELGQLATRLSKTEAQIRELKEQSELRGQKLYGPLHSMEPCTTQIYMSGPGNSYDDVTTNVPDQGINLTSVIGENRGREWNNDNNREFNYWGRLLHGSAHDSTASDHAIRTNEAAQKQEVAEEGIEGLKCQIPKLEMQVRKLSAHARAELGLSKGASMRNLPSVFETEDEGDTMRSWYKDYIERSGANMSTWPGKEEKRRDFLSSIIRTAKSSTAMTPPHHRADTQSGRYCSPMVRDEDTYSNVGDLVKGLDQEENGSSKTRISALCNCTLTTTCEVDGFPTIRNPYAPHMASARDGSSDTNLSGLHLDLETTLTSPIFPRNPPSPIEMLNSYSGAASELNRERDVYYGTNSPCPARISSTGVGEHTRQPRGTVKLGGYDTNWKHPNSRGHGEWSTYQHLGPQREFFQSWYSPSDEKYKQGRRSSSWESIEHESDAPTPTTMTSGLSPRRLRNTLEKDSTFC